MYQIKKTITVLAGIFLLITIESHAQKGQGDVNGMGMAIEKPPIEMISGELDHMKTGPCEHTTGQAVIGTHLFLKSAESDQMYNIHLGAAYATESFVEKLNIGQNIDVQAFRTDKMDEYHYIAKEVTVNGHTTVLRDDELRPFWAGDRNPRRNARFDRRRGGRW